MIQPEKKATGTKERADLLLVKQGLAPSREKAKAMIMAGQVFEGTNRIDKAGEMIGGEKELNVKGQRMPYVGRGGFKLEKALEVFPIDLKDKTMLDIGASTGGFTDCALQHSAAKIYAVDVGYGQLDWKLRQDPRVIVLEKTNARYLTREALEELVDFVTVDVSFISLDKILPVLPGMMKADGSGVALVKPQFEAGRGHVGKKGVVSDPSVHKQVLEKIRDVSAEAGLAAYGLTWSPIKGPEGNIEYLWWFGIPTSPEFPAIRDPIWHTAEDYGAAVEEAFMSLR
ncbi:MAG: TlyA family RNA methyltransferase [Peptococcaceae bacterium]|jgi:23S rRNA (cytidine1920-2'-O)/16S rRNA (cytidine1409-2'-O)-methyltransferase|nr:TlyA family RNA methyltransferase [Peptococcaceae bacterium]